MRKVWIMCAGALIAAALDSIAQCALPTSGTSYASNINFTPLGNPPSNISGSALTDAINKWAYGCSGSYGVGFPAMTTGPYSGSSGNINVYVSYQQGLSTAANGGCGHTQTYISEATGAITGAFITVWPQQANGADCTEGWENLLAHEIGHVLGLGDAYNNPGCTGTMMGSSPTDVTGELCDAVHQTWSTPSEANPPDPITICDDPDRMDGTCSPILINLRPGPYKLSGGDDPVTFDIDADGLPNRIGWTSRESGIAFLALDRNGNQTIDDGSELFGTATLLRSGVRAANGFEALRELDSNGDAVIDASDEQWRALLLWIDTSHDGVSQSEELQKVDISPVRSIETGYHWTNRRDSTGNVFRYRGTAHFGDGSRTIWDVYFRPAR
jgi:hypothetical protein